MPEPGRPHPITPPEVLADLPFEILELQSMAEARTYRVSWRTIADDGYPEETSDIVKVPTGQTVESYLEDFIAGRKAARVRANVKAREKRAATSVDLPTVRNERAMLARLKAKADHG